MKSRVKLCNPFDAVNHIERAICSIEQIVREINSERTITLTNGGKQAILRLSSSGKPSDGYDHDRAYNEGML